MAIIRAAMLDAIERLRGLDACAVSDALDRLGLPGAVSGIVPLWPSGRIAGRVRTIELRPMGEDEARPAGPHLGARTIDSAVAGDVIVVANGGRSDSGAWGGLLAAAARRNGVAGVIVDGASRDVDDAARIGFPVFARSATPVSARGRSIERATDGTVTIGDVTVEPGGLVIADRSGVVFVPAASMDDVLAAAERITRRERSMLDQFTEGATVTSVLDRRYESMLDGGDANDLPGEGEGGARVDD